MEAAGRSSRASSAAIPGSRCLRRAGVGGAAVAAEALLARQAVLGGAGAAAGALEAGMAVAAGALSSMSCLCLRVTFHCISLLYECQHSPLHACPCVLSQQLLQARHHDPAKFLSRTPNTALRG